MHFDNAASLSGRWRSDLRGRPRGLPEKGAEPTTPKSHRNHLASQAATDAATAFSTMNGMMARRRAAMGLGPSAGYDSLVGR